MKPVERVQLMDALTQAQKGLSKTSRDALDDFESGAKQWGYMEDQGVGDEVTHAHDDYMLSLLPLIRRITKLEQEAKAARKLRKAVRWALGEDGHFATRPDGDGQFWWRRELRKRSGLKPRGYRGR